MGRDVFITNVSTLPSFLSRANATAADSRGDAILATDGQFGVFCRVRAGVSGQLGVSWLFVPLNHPNLGSFEPSSRFKTDLRGENLI
jgi:hypothetical protein